MPARKRPQPATSHDRFVGTLILAAAVYFAAHLAPLVRADVLALLERGSR